MSGHRTNDDHDGDHGDDGDSGAIDTELAVDFGKVPDEVTIGAEVLEQLGGGSNMTIEVALCLAKELPKTPNRPLKRLRK